MHLPAGAMDAGMPVGGIRISREAGTTVRTASYLPTDCAVFCRFLSSRKVSASHRPFQASILCLCMQDRDTQALWRLTCTSVALKLCPCPRMPHSIAIDDNMSKGCTHCLERVQRCAGGPGRCWCESGREGALSIYLPPGRAWNPG